MGSASGVSAAGLRELFDHPRPLSFGVEEEVMVLDRETLGLLPRAAELRDGLNDAAGVKLELPAAHLEIVTSPRQHLAELADELVRRRAALARALDGRALLASAGVHPFSSLEGELNGGERYERMVHEYGPVARRQLVCGLHVHVGLSGAERVLAVYNALRAHLPALAALGANAPILHGSASGLASLRPLIAGALPRQGVPPAHGSWEQLAEELSWGARAGALEGLRGWWWELRLHAELGTIEVRAPDAQTTAADTLALAGTVAGLVLWLAECHDAGRLPPPAPGWRIGENRWSAIRHGVHGSMTDLHSAEALPTRDVLHRLLDEIAPHAERVGGRDAIAHARTLVECNGADRRLATLAEEGPVGVARALAADFTAGVDLAEDLERQERPGAR